MILIKTKDNLYNFNNLINIFISNDKIKIMDATSIADVLYENENKEVVQKVYNIIQNQIIDLNTKEVGDYVNVETIIKEVEGTKTDDRIYWN